MSSSKMPQGNTKANLNYLPTSKIQEMVRQVRERVNSDTQPTISSRQARRAKRRPPRDTECTNRFLLPAPKENDILSILLQAIKELGDGGEDFPVPSIEPVDVEWVNPTASRERQLPEQEYESLKRDNSPRLMYAHSGGYL